ncbi:MAG TPA: hypothetical protein VFG20_06635 [Planctomycetaceae bacterium]|nr:hypothetical protein [Planctomycetaceae bacterium]
MATDSALIDRIVSNVLAQLQPSGSSRAVMTESKPVEPAPAAADEKPAGIELLDPVITAKLLQDRAGSATLLRFGPKSLLTPSARDWLHTRKIAWSRESTPAVTGTNASTAKRRWLISTMTPTVRAVQSTLARDFPAWNCDLIGKATEAVEAITRLITTAEAELVIVSSDRADLIACYANRSTKVRAAVASSAEAVTASGKTLGANVVVFDPTGKSYIELRNILRSCAVLGRPQPPLGWD